MKQSSTLLATTLVLLAVGAPAFAAVRYVDSNNATPASPYTNWAGAAQVIQDAIDAANPGDEILVTNGVYDLGGRPVYGNMTNRVAVDKPLALHSVHGPQFTIIRGNQMPLEYGDPNGDDAIRCVYLTNSASMSGFTLTNGATQTITDGQSDSGGGLWCESANVIVSNCVISGNSAYSFGGGAYGGTLNNCTVASNTASWGGGVHDGTLYGCTVTGNSAWGDGGGAYDSMLTNCTLSGNSAWDGGGVYASTLNDCTLSGNLARRGGGANGGWLQNCTLIENSADYYGGGAYSVTLTNCTLTSNTAHDGGGAYWSTINNCMLTGNVSTNDGGGAYWGTLTNCTLSGNWVSNSGGGASRSSLYNCTLTGNSAQFGGGAFQGMLSNCDLSGNWADWGGGVYGGTLKNCALTDNWADWGGGAYYSTLTNCTLTSNGAEFAGGAYISTLRNCIVIFNSATGGNNQLNSTLNYCCTTPQPTGGLGNISSDPLFADYAGGNLRLESNSPCVNAGNNANGSAIGSTDLDGRPRIQAVTVDMGAYEFQPGVSGEFIGWLSDSGLPTDGSADYGDADTDGHNAWQEWRADTNPTNALSVLRLLSPTVEGIGVTVSWQSVNTRNYFLERGSNPGAQPPLSILQTNIPGQAGETSFTDTNAVGTGPFFYRVGVQ